MRGRKELNDFDFYINLQTGSSVKVEDKILLFDNLHEENNPNHQSDSDYQNEILNQDVPIKINFALVLFCTEGEMRLQLNLKDITVRKNCIFGVMPGSVGKLYYLSDNFKSASLFFSNSNYQPTMDIQQMIKSQHLIFNNPVIEISTDKMKEFIDIYKTIHIKLSDDNFKNKLELANAYFKVLKVYWDECHEQHALNIPQTKPSRQKALFDSFLNEIIQHYREERSIAFYADKLYITPKYLSKVIKDISNKQPTDWIKELVILEAKALLRTQRYTVLQISEQLNFTSASFFGRYFKEAVGCSPRKYQIES